MICSAFIHLIMNSNVYIRNANIFIDCIHGCPLNCKTLPVLLKF